MSTVTTNYNFVKPTDNETADIAVINGNMDLVDQALNPIADTSQVPYNNGPFTLAKWVSVITNRLTAWLGGGLNWWATPPITLTATKSHIDNAAPHSGHALASDLTTHLADDAAHGAVSTAAANRLILRDANGRAQVAAPSAADDIARKADVDTKLNATAYTAVDILTKIKTVDGAGSGLDADLLDGQQASDVQAGARNLTSSLRVEVVSADPGSPSQGRIIYNTTEGKFKGYSGSAWL